MSYPVQISSVTRVPHSTQRGRTPTLEEVLQRDRKLAKGLIRVVKRSTRHAEFYDVSLEHGDGQTKTDPGIPLQVVTLNTVDLAAPTLVEIAVQRQPEAGTEAPDQIRLKRINRLLLTP